jgi:hypothetical protein
MTHSMTGVSASVDLLARVSHRLVSTDRRFPVGESNEKSSRECDRTVVYLVSRAAAILHLSVLTSPQSPQHAGNDQLLRMYGVMFDALNEIAGSSPFSPLLKDVSTLPLGTLSKQHIRPIVATAMQDGHINYNGNADDSSASRRGRTKGSRKDNRMRMCFFSLALNGMPFLTHHIEEMVRLKAQYGIDWEWHIVEGFAHGRANQETPYATDSMPSSYVNKSSSGTGSTDGTTEYIAQLVQSFPGQITVHRPNDTSDARTHPSSSWHDKIQMANRALLGITDSCVLVQLDLDELWLSSQWARASEMFGSQTNQKKCAYFDCHFLIAPGLVTTTRGAYSHNDEMEWQRMWVYEPGMFWISHAPPRLVERRRTSESINTDSNTSDQIHNQGQWRWTAIGHKSNGSILSSECFTQQQTSERGLVFTHHAYTTRAQVAFKERFYGYRGALLSWERLRRRVWECQGRGNKCAPIRLASYLPWIHDDATADVVSRARIGAHVPLIPAPTVMQTSSSIHSRWNLKLPPWLNDTTQLRREHKFPQGRVLAIDGVIFQLHAQRAGGIAHVWERLLPLIVEKLVHQGWRIVLLQRTDLLLDMDRSQFASGTATGGGDVKASWSWLQNAERAGLEILKVDGYMGWKIRENEGVVDVKLVEEVLSDDERMLAQACEQVGATAFLSTLYTFPTASSTASSDVRVPWMLIHDMLPEDLGWDTGTDSEWMAKHRAIRHAEGYITVSQHTKRRLEHHLMSILSGNNDESVAGLLCRSPLDEQRNSECSLNLPRAIHVMPLTVDVNRCQDSDVVSARQGKSKFRFAGMPYVLHVGSWSG